MTSPRAGGEGPVLVGREPTLEVLRAFVRQAHERGGALVLVGAAGVGKTAVLEAAARGAGDATVLRAQGVELEKDLALSGLHQALLPLGAETAAMPPGPRAALSVVLGTAQGPVPDGRTLREAVFVLLHRASRVRPVLLVVDDLHEMDRTSADVLLDVGRRLHGTRIGLLAGVCGDADDLPDLTRLRHQELGAPYDDLADPAAGARRSAYARRRRVLTAARIEGLPAPARHFLLAAALAESADLDLLLDCVHPTDHVVVLRTAAATPLVDIDHLVRTVHFTSPIDRVAVADLATSRERIAAHRALAAVFVDRPDARARHLAEAADGPDEEIAGTLERAAVRRRAEGDAVGAVTTLRRAAELTPHGPARGRRLARAAALGVEVTGLRAVPGDARTTAPQLGTSLACALAAARFELHGDGDLDAAHRLLVEATAKEPDRGPRDDSLVEALHTWLTVCTAAGRDELWAAFHSELSRLGPSLGHTVDVGLWDVGAAAVVPASTLEPVTAAIDGLHGEADPLRIVRVGTAAWHLGRLENCRDALRDVAHDRRTGGASGITAQVMLAFDAFHTGRWSEAGDMAREALTSSDAQGYRLLAAHGRLCLALVAAARGDAAAVSALTDDVIGWAVPRGARTLVADAGRVRALAALGHGDFEEAHQEAAALCPPRGPGRGHGPTSWSAMDLVEAAVRTHRHREAAAHVAALREVGASSVSPRLALHAAAAAAMAASDELAGELYEAALRVPGADRSPFDVARVRLAYGQHLRRARATTAARTQLSAALDTFVGLGAQPWTTRTSVELRATGHDPGAAGSRGPASLTAQEWEVASLAASGMTNRQIAERLGLSSRTVDAHLYRAFPKLRITGRAGLRDALDRAADR